MHKQQPGTRNNCPFRGLCKLLLRPVRRYVRIDRCLVLALHQSSTDVLPADRRRIIDDGDGDGDDDDDDDEKSSRKYNQVTYSSELPGINLERKCRY